MAIRTFYSYTPSVAGPMDWPVVPGFAGPVAWQAAADWELVVPSLAYTVVLARRSEFHPATGDPEMWKPGLNYGYGTAQLSREIGIGEVLSYKRAKTSEWAGVANACGVNLFGGTGDELEVVDVTAVVSLLSAEEEPDTGDFFTVEGKTFSVLSVNFLSEVGEERHMEMRGIRARGVGKVTVREGQFAEPSFS